MTPQDPRRIVRVRLTAREAGDPQAILNAVQNALDGHGIRLRVDRQGVAGLPPMSETDCVKDEVLETKARELAAVTLDAAASRAKKDQTTCDRDTERMVREIAAARAGAGATVKYWSALLVRIVVETTRRVATLIAGAVETVFDSEG